jgi:hypothetical protein
MATANRRTVLIAAAGAAAAAVAPAFAEGAEGAVAVFEADEPAARAFARSRALRLAVDGDRVRFARKLFVEARPARVVGMTRYADYLILAEAAREHGYRAVLAGQPGDGLFAWTAQRS